MKSSKRKRKRDESSEKMFKEVERLNLDWRPGNSRYHPMAGARVLSMIERIAEYSEVPWSGPNVDLTLGSPPLGR
jgi:hypothetical protein